MCGWSVKAVQKSVVSHAAHQNPVPSRLAVFHSNVMNANAFVKTTATAPKNSAAAHNQECQFLVSNVCITLKVFAVRLDNSRHVPAIGPRICLPPEKLAVLCTLCI